MALDQSALLELLDALKAADADGVVRHAVEAVFQALIEAEATAQIGAGPYQRTPGRVARRNGYRDRTLTTAAGDLELRIPKLRSGSSFPSLLERRRRIDQALFAVVMEAYVTGTSTRKVDDLVAALGADSGISKSEVSRICSDLDVEVTAFRDRSLAGAAFPYVFLDATFCKARTGGDRRGRGSRVTAQAVVIATGISTGGCREVLGFDVGDSESGTFWTAFLRSLRARGLTGVQLVTSDAHTGLKAAIESVLLGATWQRCRIHATRNLLTAVPKGHADMVAAAVRTIFAQPDTAAVRSQLDVIAGMLGRQFPKVEAMLRDARDDRSRTSPPSIGKRSGPPMAWNESTRRSSAAPTSSACSPTRHRCSASPELSSPRSMPNGKSATGASCPRHPWPSSSNRQQIRPANTPQLPSPPPSRHSDRGTRHPAKTHTRRITPPGGTRPGLHADRRLRDSAAGLRGPATPLPSGHSPARAAMSSPRGGTARPRREVRHRCAGLCSRPDLVLDTDSSQ